MCSGTLAQARRHRQGTEESSLVKRTYRVVLRIAVGLVLATTALVVVAALRLMSGPVDLDFMKPRIARLIDAPGNDIHPDFDRIFFEWSGISRPIKLAFTGLRFTNGQNQVIATAPEGFDLIWVSQVFFGSGRALPMAGLAALAAAAGEAALVVDGYHGFLALPTDFGPRAGRAFYLSGGYKYAMGGEGCCFLHAPPGWLMRPRNTGWFAAFGHLSASQAGVPYATDAMRFMGATFDPSGLFRLNAALGWLQGLGIGAAEIHAHVHALQARFVAGLGGTGLDPARLVIPLSDPARGNFLTFDLPDAEAWSARLDAARIVTDRRGSRLRFGFGLYHTAEEVDALLERLSSGAKGSATAL